MDSYCPPETIYGRIASTASGTSIPALSAIEIIEEDVSTV